MKISAAVSCLLVCTQIWTAIVCQEPEIKWIVSNITVAEGEEREVCFMSNISTALPYNVTIETSGSGTYKAEPVTDSDNEIYPNLDVTVETSGSGTYKAERDSDYKIHSNLDFDISAISNETVCFNLSIIDDSVDENEEQFKLNLSSNFAIIGDPSTLYVNIMDNDIPEVNWQVTELILSEGKMTDVCFSIGIAAQPYEIKINGRGKGNQTADLNQDYVIMPTNFSVESEMFYCISVHIIDDLLAEGEEQFELYFTSNSTRIGENATVCVTIEKNNGVEVGFDNASSVVMESDSEVEICLILNGSIADPVTVTVGIWPNDRLDNTVRLRDSESIVMFQRSRDSQRLCIDVLIDDNRLGNELDKTFSVFIVNISNPTIMIGLNESFVTIIDDDVPMIEWEISESEISLSEGEKMSFCFSSEIASASPYQVEVDVRSKGDGAAIAELARDYAILTPPTFTVSAANVPGEQFCVNISIIDDSILEGTEQFELSFENLLPSTSATTGSPDTIHINILDNDDVQIGFNSTTYMGSETDGMINITVSILNGTLSQELELVVGLLTMNDTAKSFSDYKQVNSTLTFTNERGSHVINVMIEDDEVDEENEHLFAVLQLESELPGVQLTPNHTTLTIVDNDRITIGINLPNYTVNENDGSVQVCATLNGTLERTVNFSLTTTDNSATSTDPEDFTALFTELQFKDDTPEACAYIPITDDNRVELPENFTVEIHSDDPDVDFAPASTTTVVTIVDNDRVVIGFEKEQYQGEEGGMVEVCAALMNGTLERSLFVKLSTGNVSSEDPLDYTAVTTDLTFNSDSSRECTSIRLVNDSLLESTKEFKVSLTTNEEQVILNPERAVVTILDTDAARIGFEQENYSGKESDEVINVTVAVLAGTLSREFVIRIYSMDLTAKSSDFEPFDKMLTFDSERSRFMIPVKIINDGVDEEDEQLLSMLQLEPVEGESPSLLINPNKATLTIVDDDKIFIGFEHSMYTVNEGDGSVEVCASSTSGLLERTVIFTLSSRDNSATSPADFSPILIELQFNDVTSKQCTDIPIIGDSIVESQENFKLMMMSNDTGVIIDTSEISTITITDDDKVAIEFERERYRIKEGTIVTLCAALKNATLERDLTIRLRDGAKIDSELTFKYETKKCTAVTYDQLNDITSFTLSLVSDDEAAILSTSGAEITVIPQRVFTQEDVLLEVLLKGLTVETFNETKQWQFRETTADLMNLYCEENQCHSYDVGGQRKRQAINQVQVTADDVFINDTKIINMDQLQITILITSSEHVVSATSVRNAVQTHSDRFAQAGFTVVAERVQVVTFVMMESNRGLSPGAIVGIVIATLILVTTFIAIIVLIIYKVRRRKTYYMCSNGSGQSSVGTGSKSKDLETVFMTALVKQQERSNVDVGIGKRRGDGNNESEMIERGSDNGEREIGVEVTVTESQ